MKHPIQILALALALSACDQGAAIEVAACAVQSQTLAVAFKDPDLARVELKRITDGLKVRDDKAIRDAVEVLIEFENCIPTRAPERPIR